MHRRFASPRVSCIKAVEEIALGHPQVVPHLGGQAPKKVIVVPGRMVNVVV